MVNQRSRYFYLVWGVAIDFSTTSLTPFVVTIDMRIHLRMVAASRTISPHPPRALLADLWVPFVITFHCLLSIGRPCGLASFAMIESNLMKFSHLSILLVLLLSLVFSSIST